MAIDQSKFDVGYKETHTQKITADMVQKFAELSGDFNPIHMDDEYAKQTRYGRRIAHGMIAAALISRTLYDRLGEGVYLAQTLKFSAPIYLEDTVTVTVEIKNLRRKMGYCIIETTVTNQNNEVVVKGEATMMLNPRPLSQAEETQNQDQKVEV